MEQRSGGLWASKAVWMGVTFACAVVFAALTGGCSGSRQAARQGFLRVVTPLPPAFLTGPGSVLLTNATGFSAHLDLVSPGAALGDRASAGQLLGRGPLLLYAPETDETTDSHRRPGGYSFIWNVAESRGFVLSEALQGYAPISADLHVTNVAISAAKAAAQRISGHPSEPADAAVSTANGSSAFEVWRALDLNGFPVRIESATNANTFTLNFSKVRLELPAADIFAPPEGFTRYTSPEAMADELAARQNNLRRKSSGGMMEPIPGLEGGRY